MFSNAPHPFGVWGPNLFLVLVNAPRLCVCLEGPPSFVLANAPRLLDWPESVYVLANAPRLCVCLQGPVWYVLSNAPHLIG